MCPQEKKIYNTEFLKDYLGFGVAGNFANHLSEAGEGDELYYNEAL